LRRALVFYLSYECMERRDYEFVLGLVSSFLDRNISKSVFKLLKISQLPDGKFGFRLSFRYFWKTNLKIRSHGGIGSFNIQLTVEKLVIVNIWRSILSLEKSEQL
ncbi:hypothetical protein F546_17925, partial [Vibrio paracholerae 877-163]